MHPPARDVQLLEELVVKHVGKWPMSKVVGQPCGFVEGRPCCDVKRVRCAVQGGRRTSKLLDFPASATSSMFAMASASSAPSIGRLLLFSCLSSLARRCAHCVRERGVVAPPTHT